MRLLENKRGKAGIGSDGVRKSASEGEFRGGRRQTITAYVTNSSIAVEAEVDLIGACGRNPVRPLLVIVAIVLATTRGMTTRINW